MRYTDKIVFVIEKGKYDPLQGKRVKSQQSSAPFLCKVTQPSLQVATELFGQVDTTNIFVHLKRPHLAEFDYCVVNDRKYFLVSNKNGKVLVLKDEG